MAADSIHIRMARLEGAYEQIDKRLTELRDDLRTEMQRLGVTLGERMARLESRLDRVEGRVDMVFYGVALAILVPIFLRVFFH